MNDVKRGAPVVRCDVRRGATLVRCDVRHGADCTCSPTNPQNNNSWSHRSVTNGPPGAEVGGPLPYQGRLRRLLRVLGTLPLVLHATAAARHGKPRRFSDIHRAAPHREPVLVSRLIYHLWKFGPRAKQGMRPLLAHEARPRSIYGAVSALFLYGALLDRRARNRPVRTEHATIARLWF